MRRRSMAQMLPILAMTQLLVDGTTYSTWVRARNQDATLSSQTRGADLTKGKFADGTARPYMVAITV